MKTYLVTYFFVDGSVYAVRYEDDSNNIEDFNYKYFSHGILISTDDWKETVNMDNVLRYTIDEIESEEK